MSELNFHAETMNETFVSADSSKMTVDNSKNKIVIKKKIVQNIKLPKRMTEKDIERLNKITMRPNLKDKLGEYIECFGYDVGNYRDMEDRHTIINLVDMDGNVYTADHIQLDFKKNIYDYTYDQGNLVRFEGIVKEYPKNGKVDYTVNITSKVKRLPSTFDNINLTFYNNDSIDCDKITNYLSCSNMTKIYDLLDNIRNKINELTDGSVSDDFIYYYIINQYFLNRATYYIYEGNLRDQGFSGNIILQLLTILSNVLKDISETTYCSLFKILKSITQYCNIIQGVKSYNDINENPKFKRFVKTYIYNENVGKKKMNKLWEVIEYRQSNFDEKNPNVFNLDINKLTRNAYQVINEFIK